MRKTTIAILAILATGLAAYSQPSANLKGKLEAGNKQLDAKLYADAAKTFNEILQQSPTNEEALSGIIVAYSHLEKLKDAQPAIDKAVSAKPNDPKILIISGKYYGLRNLSDIATKEFEKALANAPDSLKSTIYSNIASMNNQMDELESAKGNARKAIALNDKNEAAYASLGYAQYQLREYSDALDSFSMAINLNGNNPQTFFSRGMAYLKTNDKRNACADFQRSCRLGNKNGCVQYGAECAK